MADVTIWQAGFRPISLIFPARIMKYKLLFRFGLKHSNTHLTQYPFHEPLKRSRCIAEPERHHSEWLKATSCGECCLWWIVCFYFNLPVTTCRTEHAKPAWTGQGIDGIIYMWQSWAFGNPYRNRWSHPFCGPRQLGTPMDWMKVWWLRTEACSLCLPWPTPIW